MIHYVSDGWFLAVFPGDIADSAAKQHALARGDEVSAKANARGQRGIHDARHCNRAPGLDGCSYVRGNRPAYTEPPPPGSEADCGRPARTKLERP